MSAVRSGNALLSQNATKSAAKAVLAALASGFLRYVILLPRAGPPQAYNTQISLCKSNLARGIPDNPRALQGRCRWECPPERSPPDPGPGRRQSLCKEPQDAVPNAGPAFPGTGRGGAQEKRSAWDLCGREPLLPGSGH